MNKNDSKENEEENDDSEQIEQLLRANEQLRQQLVSLSALSNSLAQQHLQTQAGDALVCFGEGRAKRWVNVRSIRMLSLAEGTALNYGSDSPAGPSGTYAVMVDELQATGFLPPDEAEQLLDQWADALNRAMQPPQQHG